MLANESVMHEYKKCCLLCIKSDECFVTDNSPFVDRLKVIYGTKEVCYDSRIDDKNDQSCDLLKPSSQSVVDYVKFMRIFSVTVRRHTQAWLVLLLLCRAGRPALQIHSHRSTSHLTVMQFWNIRPRGLLHVPKTIDHYRKRRDGRCYGVPASIRTFSRELRCKSLKIWTFPTFSLADYPKNSSKNWMLLQLLQLHGLLQRTSPKNQNIRGTQNLPYESLIHHMIPNQTKISSNTPKMFSCRWCFQHFFYFSNKNWNQIKLVDVCEGFCQSNSNRVAFDGC